jgi:arylsulfatase A-like enzyme
LRGRRWRCSCTTWGFQRGSNPPKYFDPSRWRLRGQRALLAAPAAAAVMMKKLLLVGGGVLPLLLVVVLVGQARAALDGRASRKYSTGGGGGSKPHIVFVMADDLGHFDVGFRNPLIKSPHLDRLVTEESLLLTRHYAYFVCSPSRRAFLSGRMPSHLGTDNHGDVHIDPRMHTVADKLQRAGYATAQAGKWHAGYYLKQLTPHGRGFDTSLGYFECCEDHFTQVGRVCDGAVDLWDTDRPGYGLNGTYGDYLYFGRAVATIENHSKTSPGTPLFFYMASQVSHYPEQAPDRFKSLYEEESCPSVVEYAMSTVLDEGLHNLTATLKRVSMWDRTLLVLSADNVSDECLHNCNKHLTRIPPQGGPVRGDCGCASVSDECLHDCNQHLISIPPQTHAEP